MISSDYLVIGSGIAGLSFALKAAEKGSVIIITKRKAGDSSTSFAQGGIACVSGPEDNEDSHVLDTLRAGAGHCNEKAVRLMVHEAAQCIRELLELGVDFDKENENWDLHREGGHSSKRIFHYRDMTGDEIERKLLKAVKQNKNILILENSMALDLICQGTEQEKYCQGAYILSEDASEIKAIRAKHTVICSGGAGQIFRYTSNPSIATGDGIAMAERAGAEIADMEFFQFHPTCLIADKGRCLLITEALRGEGAELINAKGEAFMKQYHPLGSLAPRDIVSRAIISEIRKSGHPSVYLKLCPIKNIRQRFPQVYENCMSVGIDPEHEFIPVIPAAHYLCGGIKTGLDGRSSIKNLYSFGEAACTGVHGANRLASNSLLEALVFAKQAFLNSEVSERTELKPENIISSENKGEEPDEKLIHALRSVLQQVMWKKAGIIRRREELHSAWAEIESIREHAVQIFHHYKKTIATAELLNLCTVAQLLLDAAIKRKSSIGLHFVH